MKIEVSIILEVPNGTSQQDLQAWLDYGLGYNGHISLENPLLDKNLESLSRPQFKLK